MNDLFRRDPPRMSDEEDRRTWERVRTAATRPAPWWSALWARPAVRFGLPAVAVVLVAVVWIAVEQPASTHRPGRQQAALEKAPGGGAGAPAATAPPEPAGTAALKFVPAPVTERKSAAKPAARDLDVLQKKFAEAPSAQSQGTLRDGGAAGKSSKDASGAPINEKEEQAQAGPEVTALRAGVRTAPAPTSPAPAAGANALAPANKPSSVAGSTFGAMKQTSKGDSGLIRVRGGRADEYSFAQSFSLFERVSPLIASRPRSFTAPLPVPTRAGSVAPDTVRIELRPDGVASARYVIGGELTQGSEGPPGRSYARFEDAGPTEQILLVAWAADRWAPDAPPSIVQRLHAEAQRLAAQDGPERRAAQELLSWLPRKWGPGAAYR